MAHAWHTMLDLDNMEILENYQRVNKSRIYENVPYINGVIAQKTYGLQVFILRLKMFLQQLNSPIVSFDIWTTLLCLFMKVSNQEKRTPKWEFIL